MPRRQALQLALALGTGAAAGAFAPAVRACEFFAPNLRITHPWTRAAPQEAPYAVVCMKFDEVTQDDALVHVETPVASGFEFIAATRTAPAPTELAIRQGRETLLAETGVQLRLTGLLLPLEMARSYPLKLVFAAGGSVDAQLSVDYARFR